MNIQRYIFRDKDTKLLYQNYMEDCNIEIISSTIVDIKFFTSFQIVFIFREEIEEKKTNKVEKKEESKKLLVEDEDRY